MTPEAIHSLPAGREMDAEVAMRVFGVAVGRLEDVSDLHPDDGNCSVYRNTATGEEMRGMVYGPLHRRQEPMDGRHLVPPYSTDIAAAFEVVARTGMKWYLWVDENEDGFWCRFIKPDTWPFEPEAMAGTPALAICRAALLATL